MVKKKDSLLGIVSLFCVALIWGGGFIFTTSALNSGWSEFPLLMARGFIGGIVGIPFVFTSKLYKNWRLLCAAIINGVLLFLGFSFQTFGQNKVGSSSCALLTSLNIIFVPILMLIVFKEKLKKRVCIASLMAFIGAILISVNDCFITGSFVFNWGDLLVIICAFAFALQIVYAGHYAKNIHPIALASVSLLVMGLLSLICMPISKQTEIPNSGWLSVLYLALFSSFLASVLQYFGQKRCKTTVSSIIMAQESSIAVILGAIVAWKFPDYYTILGAIVMISAVFVCELPVNKGKEMEQNESCN